MGSLESGSIGSIPRGTPTKLGGAAAAEPLSLLYTSLKLITRKIFSNLHVHTLQIRLLLSIDHLFLILPGSLN